MALQQTFSPRAVIGGQEFYRLFQPLESAGDIFEIDSSIKAVALGPQSDVADLQLTYFDEQTGNRINEAFLSPQVPFIGRLDTLLFQNIPSSSTPARLQVTTRDIVNNTFTMRAGDPDNDLVAVRIKPSIDLLGYLSDPPALPRARVDRQYFFPFVVNAADIGLWYILPYYGRHYGHVQFINTNFAAAVTYTLDVYGVQFSAGADVTNGDGKQGETLLGTITATQGQTQNLIFGLCEGLFDMLAIRLTSTIGTFDPDSTLRVTVSDT